MYTARVKDNQKERITREKNTDANHTLPRLESDVAIRDRIFTIRDVQVILDRDLAELYGVPTGTLNQAVKRNKNRFPEHFMFQLSVDEFRKWKSQIVISNLQEAIPMQNLRRRLQPNSSAICRCVNQTVLRSNLTSRQYEKSRPADTRQPGSHQSLFDRLFLFSRHSTLRVLTRGRQGSGFKGSRTERMAEQLAEFKAWLRDNPVNARIAARTVGARASVYWRLHEKTFAKDAKRTGEKRGFSSPRTLASAYRNCKA